MENNLGNTENIETIKTLIALTLADVDIFLLKETDQKTDKTKTFTVKEIRNQLELSNNKMKLLVSKLASGLL